MKKYKLVKFDQDTRNIMYVAIIGGYSAEVKQALLDNSADLLISKFHGWSGDSLGFLSELTFLKGIKFIDTNISDTTPINLLTNLVRLDLENKDNSLIDFDNFKKLKCCFITWRKKVKNLFSSKSIEILYLDYYKNPGVTGIKEMIKLKTLTITNTTLESLEEIGELNNLISLNLHGGRKITSIKPLTTTNSCENLIIDGCKNIQDIELLGTIRSLKKLWLSNVGNLKSLTPFLDLSNLKTLGITEGTKIIDGKTDILLHMKHLKETILHDFKFYSMTSWEINEILDKRNRNKQKKSN